MRRDLFIRPLIRQIDPAPPDQAETRRGLSDVETSRQHDDIRFAQRPSRGDASYFKPLNCFIGRITNWSMYKAISTLETRSSLSNHQRNKLIIDDAK